LLKQASRAAAQTRAAAKAYASAAPAGTVFGASVTPANNDVVQEGCTPNRPGYAANLMDAALAKANYNPADMYRQSMNFGGNNGAGMTCGVNGQSFMFPDPNPLVMPLGRIVEWGFRNVGATVSKYMLSDWNIFTHIYH
jgi:hypothetical protein